MGTLKIVYSNISELLLNKLLIDYENYVFFFNCLDGLHVSSLNINSYPQTRLYISATMSLNDLRRNQVNPGILISKFAKINGGILHFAIC